MITFYVSMTRTVEWNEYQIEDDTVVRIIARHMDLSPMEGETIEAFFERAETTGKQARRRAQWEAVLANLVGFPETWDGCTVPEDCSDERVELTLDDWSIED